MANEKFNITFAENIETNSLQVDLSGELTIDNSSMIHNQLLNKAINKDIVTIDVSGISNLDLSIIQLILSFIVSRNKYNKSTNIEFNIDDNSLEIIQKTGVTDLLLQLQAK